MKSHRAPLTSALTVALTAALAALGIGAPASALPQDDLVRTTASAPDATPSPLPSRSQRPVVLAASPVPGSVALGSRFGVRPGRLTHRRTFHAGLDFPAPKGTSVFAARPGTVERVVHDEDRTPGFRGYGNAVVLYHPDDDHWTFYAHLSDVTVVVGQQVLAGQPLGAVGGSSNGRFHGMGTHLHFEVRHRRPHGEAPFPGPYRWNNLNPARWLAERGLRYGAGGLVVTAERSAAATGPSRDGALVVGGVDRPAMVLAAQPAAQGSGFQAWRVDWPTAEPAAKPVDAK
jgi:murein DD-endopeptidase MepM/ murein hydrolase activator NlpD